MQILNESEKKMDAVIDFFNKELKGFRTGRAHPALVETVTVDVYGATMKLSDVATISIPENRQLLISPFDANNTAAIAKGIIAANLNLQPNVEGSMIRIQVPEPDASYRQEMIKQLRRKSEESKVAIRNIRREANEKAKKTSDMTEDAVKSLEKKIQDLTNKFCKTIDDLTKSKEVEISSV